MYLENAKTIVIKIGSSLLIDDNKKIKTKWLKEFVKDVQKLLNEKKNIILVSSGAIALGCKKLGLKKITTVIRPVSYFENFENKFGYLQHKLGHLQNK